MQSPREAWRELRSAEPGKRFERQYRSNQKSRKSKFHRPVSIGLGIGIILVGLVALPAPGPGVLVIGFGAALLARESLWVAQRLDWAEVRLRRLLRRFRRSKPK